jgi:hypothetical protein
MWFFILFGGFLCLLFLIFVWINKLKWLSNASVQEQTSVAQRLARGVDKQIGEFIRDAGKLYQVIQSGGAILDYQTELDNVFDTLASNKTIKDHVPEKYAGLYGFGQQRLPHKDDLLDLLGPDRVRTYLVALMNTSEARPNGWFFGSYAIIQLYRGKLVQYKVFDSYYAYYQSTGAKLVLDANYQKVLGQQSINFISPNVYGFTPQDGGNIKILYEQLFPGQNIDGVIMIKSDLLEFLIPGLKAKLIERQFVNASIDLIRWESLPNKKEKYLEDIGGFLEANMSELINQIIQNIWYIQNSQLVQVYLPKSSESFQEFLSKQKLSLVQNLDDIYVWQLNKSFNKIDKFVNKKFVLQDKNGRIINESNDTTMEMKEKKDEMKNGEVYELYFFYTLNVPQTYKDQIFSLTEQYDIELTQREQHILWLSYNRQNQIIVHLPSWLAFQDLDGEVFCGNDEAKGKEKGKCYKVIEWKHNQIVTFDVLTFGNNVLRVVRMKVKKV